MCKYSDWIPFGKPWSYEVTNIEIDRALRSNERWSELDLLLQSVDLKVGDGDDYLRQLQVEYTKNKRQDKEILVVDMKDEFLGRRDIKAFDASRYKIVPAPVMSTSYFEDMQTILGDETWEKHEEFKTHYWKLFHQQQENLKLHKEAIDEIADIERKIVSDLITDKKNNSFLGLGLNKPGTEFCVASSRIHNSFPSEEYVYTVHEKDDCRTFDPYTVVLKYRVPLENVPN